MSQDYNLLIVESPNKSKTIAKYLKDEPERWKVMATLGHILNLPDDEHGIEQRGDAFVGKWIYEKGKKKLVEEIAEVAAQAKAVWVATDPDREGEKIALDIVARANLSQYHRVTFNEITKSEILAVIKDRARTLDVRITEAQRARRYIDREVGYPISQLIRADFKRSHSEYRPSGVGRVLSAALHILAENEKRIEAFVSEPYWQIVVDYAADGIPFRATNQIKFKEENIEQLQEVVHQIRKNSHIIEEFKPDNHDIAPYPPLTTSRLQRGGFYLFGFDPNYSMALAQQLFELGYITYHRTDSYRISDTAVHEMTKVLVDFFGAEHTLVAKREFRKTKKIADAHEAVRPTCFAEEYFPSNIYEIWKQKGDTNILGKDHFKLYEFIFYRTIAVQLKNAVYDKTQVVISVAGVKFKAQANHQLYPGWEMIGGRFIKASERNERDEWKDREVQLPFLTIGDTLAPVNVEAIEKKTRQPDRYGIGRFITTLDDAGIARPSTLDSIIPSLKSKEYVFVRNGMLYVSELGKAVDDWVVAKCPWMADREHAKEFEDKLDLIESGEMGTADELITEYHNLVQALKTELGIDLQVGKPTPSQIEYATKIAQQKGMEIPEGLFESDKSTASFIQKNQIKKVEVGLCPECKTGKVIMRDKIFGCSGFKDGCKFVLWIKSAESFLDRFKIEHTKHFLKEVVQKALGKKPMYLTGIPSKGGSNFDAAIVLSKHETYGWQLGFEFKSKKL